MCIHRFVLFRFLPVLLLLTLVSLMPLRKKEADPYLFAYYSGDGGSGLHLAWSEDGRKFQVLKKGKSFLKPGVGDYLFLDPHLMQSPDGIYHLVWAAGHNRKDIAYAWSKNLIDWSPQSLIKVMEKEDSLVLGLSGPEMRFDQDDQRFFLTWACTVKGKFPETARNQDSIPGGFTLNPRLYRKSSSDLSNWSSSELWLDPGYPVSDASIVSDSGRNYLLFHDASNLPGNFQHNVKLLKGFSLSSGSSSEKPVLVSKRTHAEAPAGIRIDSNYVVFYHRYKSGKTGASITRDFKKWKDYSDSVSFPKGARHGCLLQVPEKVMKKLKNEE
jgi:hypothetical protein